MHIALWSSISPSPAQSLCEINGDPAHNACVGLRNLDGELRFQARLHITQPSISRMTATGMAASKSSKTMPQPPE